MACTQALSGGRSGNDLSFRQFLAMCWTSCFIGLQSMCAWTFKGSGPQAMIEEQLLKRREIWLQNLIRLHNRSQAIVVFFSTLGTMVHVKAPNLPQLVVFNGEICVCRHNAKRQTPATANALGALAVSEATKRTNKQRLLSTCIRREKLPWAVVLISLCL